MNGSRAIVFAFAMLVASAAAGRAQTMNVNYYYFSSYQCDPLSCVEQTPTPVYSGYARVNLNAVCTIPSEATHPLSGTASAVVGGVGTCHSAYTPYALIERNTIIVPIDSCNENSVDTATFTAEVWSASGTVLFSTSAKVQCNFQTTGKQQSGSLPC
jgi:hypothetical protein